MPITSCRNPLFLLLLCAFLAGCATTPGTPPPSDPDRPWVGSVYRHQAVAVTGLHPHGQIGLFLAGQQGLALDGREIAGVAAILAATRGTDIPGQPVDHDVPPDSHGLRNIVNVQDSISRVRWERQSAPEWSEFLTGFRSGMDRRINYV